MKGYAWVVNAPVRDERKVPTCYHRAGVVASHGGGLDMEVVKHFVASPSAQ